MKIPFSYKNIHSCEAVVLTCIDFRFWFETVKFIKEELGIDSFDFPSLPGAAKAINEADNNDGVVMKCISVPCDLHHTNKIVIINHSDCGAYGGKDEFGGDDKVEQNFHEKELEKAREKLTRKYPEKEIVLVYAKLADDENSIEFLRVN